MTSAELQTVAQSVLRRAEQQGFVIPLDIRGELLQAGQDESRWKEVVELLRDSLKFRQGRYYFIAEGKEKLTQENQQRTDVREMLKELLEQVKTNRDPKDRRREDRIPYTQPLKILTEDNQELTVLSQDLSPSGIRFIANRSFLGRKVRIMLPKIDQEPDQLMLVVRILWTTGVTEGLFENGGTFLEMIQSGQSVL